MDKKKIANLLFAFFLLFGFSASAQQNFDSEFKIGLDLYNAAQYRDALAVFDRISTARFNSKTTLASIFKAKTEINLTDFNSAELTLLKFLELHPRSKYADEAKLTLAKVYLETGKYLSSFGYLTDLAAESSSPFYRNYSKSAGEKVALKHLTPQDLDRTLKASTSDRVIPFLLLLKGKLFVRERNFDAAEEAFLKILTDYPDSFERSEAGELYRSSRGTDTAYKTEGALVGILLPLEFEGITSEGYNTAREILEGIKFAVSDFNKDREEKVGLVVRNTAMNNDTIAQIKDEFSRIPSMRAIIGPIYSAEVREAITIFNDLDLPIISPTATDNDLTQLNDHFFQANPSFSVRGKIMAQFIYFVENKRSIAILNAIDGYSPLLASTFSEEFTRLGGSITAKETYKTGNYDVDKQIRNIMRVNEEIEGIYIPIADKSDAPMILAKLSELGYTNSIYGNQDWLLARSLEVTPEQSEKLIFSSDYFIDYNSGEFLDFSREFFNRTGSDISRNSLYGYDAAKYTLSVLRNISGGSRAIKLKMESGFISTGYHNNISFDDRRINLFLNIVRYRNQMFELVDKFKSSNYR